MASIKVGATARAGALDGAGDRRTDAFRIVAVDVFGGDAIAGAAVAQALGRVLRGHRGRERVTVVLDDQDHRQLPHRRHVEALVEIAGGRATVADEVDCQVVAPRLLEGECGPGSHRNHGAEMADHADVANALLRGQVAVVKRSLDAIREAVGATQELAAQAIEQLPGLRTPIAGMREEAEVGESPRRIQVERQDGAQIAMQRTQDVARLESQAGGDGGGLSTDLAVPLRQSSGAQQHREPRVEIAGEAHVGVGKQPPLRGVVHGRQSVRIERVGGKWIVPWYFRPWSQA